VQDSLKALSKDPDSFDLQRKADRLLASGPLFRKQAELRVESSEMNSEQQRSVFDAFLFVDNSEGVQVGDHATQRNQFLYVVAPTLDAAQLLADDPSVRCAIIDCICSPDEAGAGALLRDELAAALEWAVLSCPDIRTAGDLVRLPTRGRVEIDGGDGVSIGKKGQQRNEASAKIVVPGTVVESVQENRITTEILAEEALVNDEEPRTDLQSIDDHLGRADWITSSSPKKELNVDDYDWQTMDAIRLEDTQEYNQRRHTLYADEYGGSSRESDTDYGR
jgi:hypothetical protein